MRISLNHLKQYYNKLPGDIQKLRDMFDELGLEVKRIHEVASDTIFTLELLANRGDHMSYWGVATELAGRFGGKVTLPKIKKLSLGKNKIRLLSKLASVRKVEEGSERRTEVYTPVHEDSSTEPTHKFSTGVEFREKSVKLKCESDLCLRYTATLLEVDDLRKSFSGDTLYPLEAAEIHSIDAAVDATNLVNLELGQPTHMFDADKIDGGITIRLSKQNEKAHLLFQKAPVVLPEKTLVIADDKKVLAIAGVIGCEESKVTTQTKQMILESATFDPVTVRIASRALKVNTDSSARFEKGADPEMAVAAVGRVIWLLEKNNIAHHVGDIGVVRSWKNKPTVIHVDPEKVQHYFQTKEFSKKDIEARLARYGFKVKSGKTMAVTVPTYRMWDVKTVEDIYEELARSVGYDNLPVRLPYVDKGSIPSPKEKIRGRVDQVLIGLGFYEVVTNGFYGRDQIQNLNLHEGHALYHHVEVINSIDKGYSLLKRTCLPQALEAVSENIRFQHKNVKLFEWTRIFVPDDNSKNKVCHEQDKLWMIVNGEENAFAWNQSKQASDVWHLKGVVEELGKTLGLKLKVSLSTDSSAPNFDFLHPHRRAVITLGDDIVGVLGEVHPRICANFDIKRNRPCYLELNLSALLKAPDFIKPDVIDLPTQMPMNRMLAFTLPHKVEAQQVLDCLQKEAPAWLESMSIVDLYQHKEENQPLRTITIALQFSNEDGSRTVTEVNDITEHLITAVVSQLDEFGVKLRQ